MNVLLNMFPNGGYFVEAGAHDGVGDSQTLELEKAGWQGICVEPSSAFEGLRKNRKCHVDNRCLYHADGRIVPFREIQGNDIELSGIPGFFYDNWDRETRPHLDIPRMTVSLTALLVQYEAPSRIEYLALDTEGTELDILQGHRFDLYRFLTIAVEHNGIPERKLALRVWLPLNGYSVAVDDGTNYFFIHESIQWKSSSISS